MKCEIKNDIRRYYSHWFRMNEIYEQWAKSHHLTSTTLFSLYMIAEHPSDCTQRLICELMCLPKQTINTALVALEKEGYIRKETVAADRRNKYIYFTETGAEYARGILEELAAFEAEALLALETGQRGELLDSWGLFIDKLQEAAGKHG